MCLNECIILKKLQLNIIVEIDDVYQHAEELIAQTYDAFEETQESRMVTCC